MLQAEQLIGERRKLLPITPLLKAFSECYEASHDSKVKTLLSKARQEIFEVLGKDRQAKLSDRERLPYTEATIMEIQRAGNVGPRGLPHATCDGPVQGRLSVMSWDSHRIRFQ